MSKKKFDLIIVIPVGPTCDLANVQDTLDSISFYTKNAKVVIIDDSHNTKIKRLDHKDLDLDIIVTPVNYGKNAGLYLSLSQAFTHVVQRYAFQVLLRMDTDALFIGSKPEAEAIEFFNHYPNVGIAGSYKYGYAGGRRIFANAKLQLLIEMSPISLLRGLSRINGIIWFFQLVLKARRNGYVMGEHVMGGACFYSYNCIKKLYDNKLLSQSKIQWSKLQEDMLFALMIKSVGMDLSDFQNYKCPLGVKWQGLPDSPENLLNQSKVIHSTRYYKNLNEKEIRRFFREKRN